MKDLDKILEYQKSDIELRKILDIIEKSDDSKRMENARAEFNNAKNTVMQCEQQAQILVDLKENLTQQRKALLDDIERLILIVENNEEEDEIENNIEQLEEMKKRLAEYEKKVNEIKGQIDKVIGEYKEANEAGRKYKSIYNETKEKNEQLKEKYSDKIKEYTDILVEKAKTIDPETFEIYKSITAQGKYPAVVDVYHDTSTDMYSCRGCGISLSQKRKSELFEDGACRCETCRRIIYKQ